MQRFLITRPDDWHVHFRDQAILQHTVTATAKHFARALVMPNLKPALTSVDLVMAYRQRILTASNQQTFTPYMTLYLNEQVTASDIELAKTASYVLGAKLYPAGATTNAEQGAKSIQALYPQLEALQDNNLVLQIHGEVTLGDIFERESLFIETSLKPLMKNFPKLRIVLEHISTKAAVDFVTEAPDTLTATITPHHLMFNRNQLLVGGIKPHYYCLPILKSERDQKALQLAATSGNPKFFAGTDSAPHPNHQKESSCGCAGIYSAPYALAMYTELFEKLDKLERLNAFLSQYGAGFYQLPLNQDQIELIKNPQTIPAILPLGHDQVVPVLAGEVLQWSVHEPR